jgi:hypothetical protein
MDLRLVPLVDWVQCTKFQSSHVDYIKIIAYKNFHTFSYFIKVKGQELHFMILNTIFLSHMADKL